MASRGRLYVMAGGGSGGHLCPGLAVVEALRELDGEARVIFMATERGIDGQILDAVGMAYVSQPVAPLPRRLGKVFDFWSRWRASVWFCEELFSLDRPHAVLGLGGFASVPAMKVAARLGVPVGMLNPDVVPGYANRWARRYADRIFLHWQASRDYFGKAGEKCVAVGCPIRKGVYEGRVMSYEERGKPAAMIRKKQARRGLGLDVEKKTVVIVGGSQGGHNVNEAAVLSLTTPAKAGGVDVAGLGWQVLHLAGPTEKEQVEGKYREARLGAKVLGFSEDMGSVLEAADVVVGRAGASTLAELTALGVPSILLPYPYHRDQHQLRNAEVLAKAEAARVVIDDRDALSTSRRLSKALRECMGDGQVLANMGAAAASLGRPEAARFVAEELVRLGAVF